MSNTPNLLPCPFCGCKATVSVNKGESLWSHDVVDWTRVHCTNDDCNAQTEAARKAVIEALSGVQALSAAPAVPAGWKAVPVNPTQEMWKAAKTVPDPNPPYPPHYGLVWDAMLAASPTPPAEQQAQSCAVYAGLPDSVAWLAEYGGDVFTATQLLNFADRTHALRMQVAPKAAPDHPPMPENWGVVVSVNSENILCIGQDYLHGKRELSEAEELAIVGMAQHLLAFVGYGLPPSIFDPDDDAAPQQEAQEPVGWDGAEEWEKLAWHLCAEENGEDACNELIWDGGPIPEPWGERWLKYEGEARNMISLVRTHVPAPQPAPAPLSEREAFETAWQKLHYENMGGLLIRRDGFLHWRCPDCKAEGESEKVLRVCPQCKQPDKKDTP